MPIVLLSFAVGEVHPPYIVDLANYASNRMSYVWRQSGFDGPSGDQS